MADVQAVIFDWGGTLTPWHDVDFELEAQALAAAAVGADDTAAALLRAAGDAVWGRSRDHHTSATVADLFDQAGLQHDASLLTGYRAFWEPHTHADPDVIPLLEGLRRDGVKVGVLSNTVWPREWHEDFFRRDGVLHLLDGAVYTSEIPWTKPSPKAFAAALDAVGATDPARCVYVGDRLYDDIWGARNAGLRAIHIPLSTIPADQVGHTEGEPDAVVHRLAEIGTLVRAWS